MNLATLLTESRNPATEHIDELPTLDMLRLINNEDAKVAQAIAAVLPDIAKAIDEITRRLNDGGRLFYIGAGTSGRLGVLDASEIPPTFSVPPTLVQGLIAGGDSALRKSSESSEDSPEQGAAEGRSSAAPGYQSEEACGCSAENVGSSAASACCPREQFQQAAEQQRCQQQQQQYQHYWRAGI